MKSRTLILFLVIVFVSLSHAWGEDWNKQLEKALQAQIQKTLSEQYVRYDKSKNIVSVSPDLMKLIVKQGRDIFGNMLPAFELMPVENTLYFSVHLPREMNLTANIIPVALEWSPEELVLHIRLLHGLNLTGFNLRKVISGVLANALESSSEASASSASDAGFSPATSSFNLSEILASISPVGNSLRLKCPLKGTSLGRAISLMLDKSADGKPATTRHQLGLSMEDNWLLVNLGADHPEKALLQMAIESLLQQLPRR